MEDTPSPQLEQLLDQLSAAVDEQKMAALEHSRQAPDLRVYLIAHTHVNWDEVHRWLRDPQITGSDPAKIETVSGYEEAIRYSQGVLNPPNRIAPAWPLAELCGRRCYLAFGAGLQRNVQKVRSDSVAYIRNILDQHHGSVLEHITYTFAIEGCTRVSTHETVRHRAGAAYSQESLRYVFPSATKIWLPPEIVKERKAAWLMLNAVDFAVQTAERVYTLLGLDGKDFATKKRFTSAIRRILPMGIATGIVATFNIRQLRWFLELRSAPGAEVEIRTLANKLWDVIPESDQPLFQDFDEFTEDGLPWLRPENSKV